MSYIIFYHVYNISTLYIMIEFHFTFLPSNIIISIYFLMMFFFVVVVCVRLVGGGRAAI